MGAQPALRRALADAPLLEALADARAFGFLGPGPVEDHIAHAVRFVAALGDRGRGPALDLGAGGGVPGLVLARLGFALPWTLLDSQQRRTAFLERVTERLGLRSVVTVLPARAEEAGRDPTYRSAFGLVVARSFGPPAVTAECGAPFLASGGHLAVSEPPGGDPGRWPAPGLGMLGLESVATADLGIAVSQLTGAVADRYPRRTGIPRKRPLF